MASITISGTVYDDQGVTPMGAGRTINVSVNGAASAASATTASDGTYTTSAFTSASGDVLTIYLQGNTEVGAVVTKGAAANLTGIDIWRNSLKLRDDNGVALTGTNLNTSDNNGATGISSIYAASSNTSLVLASGKNLVIDSGQTLSTANSTTLTTSGGGNITVNGTWTGGLLGTTTCGGNFTINGTYTAASTNTLKLSGTGSQTVKTGGSSLPPVQINGGAGSYTLQDNMDLLKSLTIAAGSTLDVSSSNYSITGVTSVFSNSGTFNARSGSVTMTGSAVCSIKSNGSSFYNLTASAPGGTLSLTDALSVTNNFTFGTGGGALDVSTSNFAITVGGNWSMSGTMTGGRSGTVTLNGAGSQTISGSTTFYNLTISGGSRTVTFTDGTTQTVSNAADFEGTSGHLLTLAGSSTAGWTIAMPATQTLHYLSVSHSTATGNAAITSNSTDGGNNVNWTFAPTNSVAPSCAPSSGTASTTFVFDSGTWMGSPTGWLWESSPDGVTWSTFSTSQNPSLPGSTFGTGTWQTRLTASNASGASTPATGTTITVTSPAGDHGTMLMLLGCT